MYLLVMFVYMGDFQRLNLVWPVSEWPMFTCGFPLKSHQFSSAINTVSDIKEEVGKNEIIKSKVASFIHFEGIISWLI